MTIADYGLFTIATRTKRIQQDIDIIHEVITNDTYRLRGMQRTGFEPKTIVSVGSHIGTFELLAHFLWPDARIISVEPNKESFALLTRNCPFSHKYNAAISYKENPILLTGMGSTGGDFVATEEEFNDRGNLENAERGWYYSITDEHPATLTFDALLEAENISHIDLLKLDCEGGEWGIMEHWTGKTSVDYIVGEYHERGFETFKTLAEHVWPHLHIYGGNNTHLGPFFSYPNEKLNITGLYHY